MLDRRVLNLQLTLWKTINHKFLFFSYKVVQWQLKHQINQIKYVCVLEFVIFNKHTFLLTLYLITIY